MSIEVFTASRNELSRLIECPVCLQVPTFRKIYQCNNGHLVCGNCHKRLLLCPICRDPLQGFQCKIAEQVLSMIPVPCLYAEYGCSEILKDLPEKRSHIQVCLFREIVCPVCSCLKNVSISEIGGHIAGHYHSDDHKINFLQKGRINMTMTFLEPDLMAVNWFIRPSHLRSEQNEDFFFECLRVKDLWHFWVFFYGPSKNASNYESSLIMNRSYGPSETFRCPIIPRGAKSFQKVLNEKMSLTLTDQDMEPFWNRQEECFEFAFQIESNQRYGMSTNTIFCISIAAFVLIFLTPAFLCVSLTPLTFFIIIVMATASLSM